MALNPYASASCCGPNPQGAASVQAWGRWTTPPSRRPPRDGHRLDHRPDDRRTGRDSGRSRPSTARTIRASRSSSCGRRAHPDLRPVRAGSARQGEHAIRHSDVMRWGRDERAGQPAHGPVARPGGWPPPATRGKAAGERPARAGLHSKPRSQAPGSASAVAVLFSGNMVVNADAGRGHPVRLGAEPAGAGGRASRDRVGRVRWDETGPPRLHGPISSCDRVPERVPPRRSNRGGRCLPFRRSRQRHDRRHDRGSPGPDPPPAAGRRLGPVRAAGAGLLPPERIASAMFHRDFPGLRRPPRCGERRGRKLGPADAGAGDCAAADGPGLPAAGRPQGAAGPAGHGQPPEALRRPAAGRRGRRARSHRPRPSRPTTHSTPAGSPC